MSDGTADELLIRLESSEEDTLCTRFDETLVMARTHTSIHWLRESDLEKIKIMYEDRREDMWRELMGVTAQGRTASDREKVKIMYDTE